MKKNKPQKKRGKKIMLVISIILAFIISLNLIGFIVNLVFFKNELEQIQPYGQMVEVGDKKMHVYSMGSSEKTIVLLPGLGVALPSADFGPLMRKLSQDYTVVTVEYFGIGFSDQIDTPRTNENYTYEIRTALDKAGFKPPYILMPHSASGIYSEYYATKYREEVSSIIMLDSTSSTEIAEMPGYISAAYSLGKFQQATGFTRLVFNLVPDTKLIEHGYTEKEKEDYKKFNYHVINDTMMKQSLLLMENIKEVKKLPFPEEIPVLKIISKQSIDVMDKKEKGSGMVYQSAHLNRLGDHVSYKVVDATHFLYHTKVDEIITLTNEFLDDVKN